MGVKRRYAIVKAATMGFVSFIEIASGSKVKAGDALVGIDIMKMLHTIEAPVDGEVELLVKIGESVEVGQMVAKIYV